MRYIFIVDLFPLEIRTCILLKENFQHLN